MISKEQKSKIGKLSRKHGAEFERKTRAHLESKGWTVCRWGNNITPEMDGIEASKMKFNPFTKSMMMGNSGFPDFVAFKKLDIWEVIGVECKTNGSLDKKEKQMAAWYLDHGTFDEFWVAFKEGSEVKYRKVI